MGLVVIGPWRMVRPAEGRPAPRTGAEPRYLPAKHRPWAPPGSSRRPWAPPLSEAPGSPGLGTGSLRPGSPAPALRCLRWEVTRSPRTTRTPSGRKHPAGRTGRGASTLQCDKGSPASAAPLAPRTPPISEPVSEGRAGEDFHLGVRVCIQRRGAQRRPELGCGASRGAETKAGLGACGWRRRGPSSTLDAERSRTRATPSRRHYGVSIRRQLPKSQLFLPAPKLENPFFLPLGPRSRHNPRS